MHRLQSSLSLRWETSGGVGQANATMRNRGPHLFRGAFLKTTAPKYPLSTTPYMPSVTFITSSQP